MENYKLLSEYINGNYKVRLFSDGTKIRFSHDNEFHPKFPESIDLKITNRCDLRCLMCHEKSTPTGKNADLNHLFFNTLNKGTELAIGGGNPLAHKDLIQFLRRMKEKGIICNITVNQIHLINNKILIQKLIDDKLIYGIGVSISKDLFLDEIIEFANRNINTVIHIIAGVIDIKILEKLYDNNLKLLVLGYKTVGRGIEYYSKIVEENILYIEKNILDISKHFNVVSFDNLSIKQLRMDEKVDAFNLLYMGDDGDFTMYIDLVKKEFASSSISAIRYKIKDDIKEMFKIIQDENYN